MQSNLRFITHRECSMPPVGKKVLLDFSFKENSNDNCRSTITKLLNIHSIRVGIIWQQTNAWDLFEWISGILFQRLVNLLPLSASLVRWTWCQWWSRDYWMMPGTNQTFLYLIPKWAKFALTEFDFIKFCKWEHLLLSSYLLRYLSGSEPVLLASGLLTDWR